MCKFMKMKCAGEGSSTCLFFPALLELCGREVPSSNTDVVRGERKVDLLTEMDHRLGKRSQSY